MTEFLRKPSANIHGILERMARKQSNLVKPSQHGLKIFISYCPQMRRRVDNVFAIAERLKCHGHNIWIDTAATTDFFTEEAANGISACDLFIFFFNDEYAASERCREEAVYGLEELKKPALAVNISPATTPLNSWLRKLLDNRVWIDFSQEINHDPIFNDIAGRIRRRFYDNFEPDGFADIFTYSFKLINIPKVNSRSHLNIRPEFEENVFKAILKICDPVEPAEPSGQGSVLTLQGDAGIGKTHIVSNLLSTKRPFSGNVAVLWLNCNRWKANCKFDYFAQIAFNDEMIALAKIADQNFKSSDCGTITSFFKAHKNWRVLFAFDSMANADVLAYFVEKQKDVSLLSCIVISRNPIDIPATVRTFTIFLEPVPCANVVHLLEHNCIGLTIKLGLDRMNQIAKKCLGSPLICNLVAAQFAKGNLSQYAIYYFIMKTSSESRSNILTKLFEFGINQVTRKDDRWALRFCAFLFFEPEELVPVDFLQLFWDCPIDSYISKILEFEALGLINKATSTSGDEQMYFINPMIWEAAFQKASDSSTENLVSLSDIRYKLLSHQFSESNYSEPLIFRALRSHYYALIDQIIDKTEVHQLRELSVMRSANCQLFVECLYKFADEKAGNGSKYSEPHRLLKRLLVKVRSQGGSKQLGHIADATIKVAEENREDDDLEETFGDIILADDLASSAEFDSEYRKSIAETMKPWQWRFRRRKELQSFVLLEGTNYPKAIWQLMTGADGKTLLKNDIDEAMRWAAMKGSLSSMKLLCKNAMLGRLLNFPDSTTIASLNGHLDLVEFLTERMPGSITNSLIGACQNGHVKVVQFLTEKQPLSLTASNEFGNASMLLACENGHIEVVKYLAEMAPETLTAANNAQNGKTPLWVASRMGHFEIVNFLAEMAPELITKPTVDGSSPTIVASQNDHLDIVVFLVEKDSNCSTIPDKNGVTPLYMACQCGHLEVARYLAQVAPNTLAKHDNCGVTPLFKAGMNGLLKCVQFLAEKAPETVTIPDIHGTTPLQFASRAGNAEIAAFLAETSPQSVITKDESGATPLFIASQFGHLDVVKALVEIAPESVSIARDDGVTALGVASRDGYLQIVRYLAGKDPTCVVKPDNAGYTPLWLATDNGHLEIVKFLVEKGPQALLETPAETGFTPIFVACQKGHTQIVKFLAGKAPHSVRLTSPTGILPLTIAASNNHYGVVKFLSDKVPDLICESSPTGYSAFTAAASNLNSELMDLLLGLISEPTLLEQEEIMLKKQFSREIAFIFKRVCRVVPQATGGFMMRLLRPFSTCQTFVKDGVFLSTWFEDQSELLTTTKCSIAILMTALDESDTDAPEIIAILQAGTVSVLVDLLEQLGQIGKSTSYFQNSEEVTEQLQEVGNLIRLLIGKMVHHHGDAVAKLLDNKDEIDTLNSIIA